MRRPNPISIPTAVQMHYSLTEMRTTDIEKLFGCSPRTARLLKEEAMKYQDEHNVPSFHPERVNTKTAFKAWGLDINELEHDFLKLKKLGVLE